MRALIQRVTQASVSVNGAEIGRTDQGLVVLLGISTEDGEEDAKYVVERVLNLRIFADDANRFNRSALDIGAELLVVSQFTLYADTRKGRRPDFTRAAPPDQAETLYARTAELFAESGLRVQAGRFREHMLVDIKNDGPVTLMIDSADRFRSRRG